jgi:hypothetical protein
MLTTQTRSRGGTLMSTQRITALAAVFALALSVPAALAQDDAQSRAGDGQQQQDQSMPRGGTMGPGQGQGMMGPGQGQGVYGPGMRGQGQLGPGGGQGGYGQPGQGMVGPGQGMMGQGMMGQGMMRPGMMRPGMMHGRMMHRGMMQGGMMQGGMMRGGMMQGGMMRGGMMQGGRANAGPTLKIETPGGLTFTCNAGMQACLQAFDRVRAANQGGDGPGN